MNTRPGSPQHHGPAQVPDGLDLRGVSQDIRRLRTEPRHNVKGGWRGQTFTVNSGRAVGGGRRTDGGGQRAEDGTSAPALSPGDLLRLYRDLDLLTEDLKVERLDRTTVLAMKREVWRRLEGMK